MSLKELLKRQTGIVVAPGCYDPMSAKLVEIYGFPCVYMTGNGNSASLLGLPDMGLMTLTEMAERVRNVRSSIRIPIIVDADTGFGSILNLRRTIKTLEAAGASAIQLEDQMDPKRCGHELGREVVPLQDMVAKIRVAVEARSRDDTLIISRTDARTSKGLDEAIERANTYSDAGADIAFVESPESVDELRQIRKRIRAPILVNMVENGRTPYLPSGKLWKMGFNLVIFPLSTILGALHGVKNVLETIQKDGYVAVQELIITLSEYHGLTGFREAEMLLKKYSRHAEVTVGR